MKNLDKATKAAAETLVSCAGDLTQFQYIVASGISARDVRGIESKDALHDANGMIRAAVEAADKAS